MSSSPSQRTLAELVVAAQRAGPNDRIGLRDSIAAHGLAAIDAMVPFARDNAMQHFAVRVIGRVGQNGHRNAALAALREVVSAEPSLNAEAGFEGSRLRASPTTPRAQPPTLLRGEAAGLAEAQAGGSTSRMVRQSVSPAVTDDVRRLLTSVASKIVDYRDGESAPMDADHVRRWVRQFDPEAQMPILRELEHVFPNTYIGRERCRTYLSELATTIPYAKADPRSFWKSANFLDIQQNGESQRQMLSLFSDVLRSDLGVERSESGSSGGPFVYLDDAIFSGGRVRQDLGAWIRDTAPSRAVVLVLTMVSHTYGEYDSQRNLREVAQNCDKDVELIFLSDVQIENRAAYRDSAEVLWPAVLPDDPRVRAYVEGEQLYRFQPRNPSDDRHRIFSSEDARQVLERELLVAGLRIRSGIRTPKAVLRPLGFSQFGLGFGSLIVTYRNCPNNAPLALWWALGGWYPLFRRKTYTPDIYTDDIAF